MDQKRVNANAKTFIGRRETIARKLGCDVIEELAGMEYKSVDKDALVALLDAAVSAGDAAREVESRVPTVVMASKGMKRQLEEQEKLVNKKAEMLRICIQPPEPKCPSRAGSRGGVLKPHGPARGGATQEFAGTGCQGYRRS